DELWLAHHRQATTVPTPDDALDDGVGARFLLQNGEFLEGRRVPQPDRAVPRGRSDLRAVGAKTRVVDVAGVAAQAALGFRLFQVPEADGAVIRCRRERVP